MVDPARFFTLLVILPALSSIGECLTEEVFSEDLLLRPLPDGKVLSHFYFRNYQPRLSAAHTHVFPKAIAQLVRKLHIAELELSFTQGRWQYERWGALDPVASSNVKPSGVELWADFDAPLQEVDYLWRNLTHALSGLFCASINFLDSSTQVVAPYRAFGPLKWKGGFEETEVLRKQDDGLVRYGALPREAVCTENLTPWLKLLPCRDKAGIASLLDRPSVYKGYYHSLRVHVSRSRTNGEGILEQTLTLVMKPSQVLGDSSKGLPHWSLKSLFGRTLDGKCPVARSSHLLVELERSLAGTLQALVRPDERTGMYVVDNPVFRVTPHPDNVLVESHSSDDISAVSSVVLEYKLNNHSTERPLSLAMFWRQRTSWSSPRGPFRVSRFLMGSGNQKGSLGIELKKNFDTVSREDENAGRSTEVTLFQVVPWYVRLYIHTLTARVDGSEVSLSEFISEMRVTPAEDRLQPAMLELHLKLPSSSQTFCLTMDFDKGFLHIDEHPPDANRGFDLPAAFLTFTGFQTRRKYFSQLRIEDEVSPLLSALEEAGPVHLYTNNLLVPLATPDFSMPYNVITFTCTVLALYFGSLFNTLRRRLGEEERLVKSGHKTKLRKIFERLFKSKTA